MFIFCNRNQDKLKIVYWDKTGFAMWYKVLQKDRFKWPKLANMQHIQLSEQQLQWLLPLRGHFYTASDILAMQW
jgi:transposase